MKKTIIIVIPIILIALGYFYFTTWCYKSATTEQQNYLLNKLATTHKILIRNHPKLGGAILAEITDKKEITELVESTKITKIEDPCACFGFKDIEFVLESGEIISINYKDKMYDTYISYENPWGFQAKPSYKFRKLIKKHLNSV